MLTTMNFFKKLFDLGTIRKLDLALEKGSQVRQSPSQGIVLTLYSVI